MSRCLRVFPNEITKKLEKLFTDTMKEPEFSKGMKDLHVTIFYRNKAGKFVGESCS